jgi:hypothetical protein
MPPPNIFTIVNHFNQICDTNKGIDFLKTKYIDQIIFEDYYFQG